MCVTQHAHCQIYSNTRLTSLLRKVLPQKTELIVTRYLPDEVLKGSDKIGLLKLLGKHLPLSLDTV